RPRSLACQAGGSRCPVRISLEACSGLVDPPCVVPQSMHSNRLQPVIGNPDERGMIQGSPVMPVLFSVIPPPEWFFPRRLLCAGNGVPFERIEGAVEASRADEWTRKLPLPARAASPGMEDGNTI